MSIIGSTAHLTIASKADRMADRTHKGQAHWATDPFNTCEKCSFSSPANKKRGTVTCRKAIEMSYGKVSAQFPKQAAACKYWTDKT